MKALFLLSLFCVLVATITAATARGSYKDPDHPGKCVIDGKILSEGDEAHENCEKMVCGKDGWVNFYSCGASAPLPGYKWGKQIMPNAPYPKCCERESVKA